MEDEAEVEEEDDEDEAVCLDVATGFLAAAVVADCVEFAAAAATARARAFSAASSSNCFNNASRFASRSSNAFLSLSFKLICFNGCTTDEVAGWLAGLAEADDDDADDVAVGLLADAADDAGLLMDEDGAAAGTGDGDGFDPFAAAAS